MNGQPSAQVLMHKDFFDKCKFAIDNGFYFEAIIIEYAAIESRLESICGQLDFPCSKESPVRKDIKISDRVKCLNYFVKHNIPVFEKTKLPKDFFTPKGLLNKWIISRNTMVHGLYKNAYEYENRIHYSRQLAIVGEHYARLLYNESKRLGRLLNNHPNIKNNDVIECKSSKCKSYRYITEEE